MPPSRRRSTENPVSVARAGEAVYVLTHASLGQAGSRNLIFTVTTGQDIDLLPISIEVPATSIAAASGPGTREILIAAAQQPLAWGAAVALLLIGVLVGRAAAPRALPPMVAPARKDDPPHALPVPAVPVAQPHRAHATAAAILLAITAVPALAQPMDAPRRQPDGSVFLPKPTQRLFGLRTTPVERSEAPVAVQLVGQVIADPNASGRVQAPQAGRVEPPSSGFPALGSRVERGQVLAYVVPVLAAQERSGVQATLAELDTQIGIAQQRAQRLAALSGSVSAREITEARAELDGLRVRRAAVAEGLNGRQAVQATATSVVSIATAVGGQIVDARELLFEIVDPARLWVEAVAFDGALVTEIAGAQATTSAGASMQLAFVGRGLALRQQAVPLQFRIADPPPGLSIGHPRDGDRADAAYRPRHRAAVLRRDPQPRRAAHHLRDGERRKAGAAPGPGAAAGWAERTGRCRAGAWRPNRERGGEPGCPGSLKAAHDVQHPCLDKPAEPAVRAGGRSASGRLWLADAAQAACRCLP